MRKPHSLALLLPLIASCTLVRVGSEDGPARLEAGGVVDGHLAFGIPEEDDFLNVELFDGRSEGSVAELSLWKLLRLEVGLAGASVGVGPLDVGLGVLAYEPESWLQGSSSGGRANRSRAKAATPRASGEAPDARPTEADVAED